MAVRVVLHPNRVTGIAAEVAATRGVDLVDAGSEAEVTDAIAAGASVLLTYRWRPEFLQPGLRWIQGMGAGFEQYPLDDLDAAGVVLTTATGVHVSVAEAAVGLVLALTRRLGEAVRNSVDHRWTSLQGPELAGSTVAIIGLGTIGEGVARRLQGWDVELIGVKRHPEAYDGLVPEVHGPDRLLEVLGRCDVAVVTLPGSDETHHMIGAAELTALGDGYLVNVGRGSVVDEAALVSALEDGRLRGAGLDVFETEPLPAVSPLWDMPNVVITPHSAGNSPRYGERLATIFRANLAAFLGGDGPWINRVVAGERRDEA